MYVCMYIYIYIYTYIHTYIHIMYMHIYTYVPWEHVCLVSFTCIYIYIYVYMYIYIYMYTYMYTYTHTFICIYIYIYIMWTLRGGTSVLSPHFDVKRRQTRDIVTHLRASYLQRVSGLRFSEGWSTSERRESHRKLDSSDLRKEILYANQPYIQFASQDLRRRAPNPWKVLQHYWHHLSRKGCPGHPTLGQKYCAGNCCDPNRV